METFTGAVAVVTGAASGIGFALARAAQARGAKLVIADIRAEALEEAEAAFAPGGEVLAVQTDVADAAAMEALAARTVERFGKVNLLFNNAGVFSAGLTWEVSRAEYDWMIDVNQKSVINGIRAFVPRMLAQQDACHVVTIASGAGIMVNPGTASYSMTKHAVVALTEALYLDLASEGVSHIGVTLAMPGFTQSGIMQPEKSVPAALQATLGARHDKPAPRALETYMRTNVSAGLPAEALAEQVFGAIARNDLYVLPAYPGGHAASEAVARGRANGQNAYPPILQKFLARVRPAGS